MEVLETLKHFEKMHYLDPNLPLDELDEVEAALTVADKDERPALVAGGEEVAPGLEHVTVGQHRRSADILPGAECDDRRALG